VERAATGTKALGEVRCWLAIAPLQFHGRRASSCVTSVNCSGLPPRFKGAQLLRERGLPIRFVARSSELASGATRRLRADLRSRFRTSSGCVHSSSAKRMHASQSLAELVSTKLGTPRIRFRAFTLTRAAFAQLARDHGRIGVLVDPGFQAPAKFPTEPKTRACFGRDSGASGRFRAQFSRVW